MPFEPGKSGNPNGRPPEPPEVKEAKRFNRQELDLSLSKLLVMNQYQLQNVKNNPEATAVELALSAVLIHAINEGDERRLEFLFNHKLGKLKESIEVSNPYLDKSYEELKTLAREILKDDK